MVLFLVFIWDLYICVRQYLFFWCINLVSYESTAILIVYLRLVSHIYGLDFAFKVRIEYQICTYKLHDLAEAASIHMNM